MSREIYRKRRLTGADWMILLLVLCIAFGVGYLMLEGRASAGITETIVYTLCIPAPDPAVAEASGGWDRLIPIDSAVTSSNGAIALGRVTALRIEPHTVVAVQNQTIVFPVAEGRVDLYVQISADAIFREGDGLRVGDVRIAAADTGDFRLGGYLARGARVVSVESEVKK